MPTGTGRFNQRVTLEPPLETVHPVTNEKIQGWGTPVRVMAEVAPLTARELVRTRQVQMDTTHRVRIRYRSDVDATWRVRWTDPRGVHTAQITGITEPVRRAELLLECAETTQG